MIPHEYLLAKMTQHMQISYLFDWPKENVSSWFTHRQIKYTVIYYSDQIAHDELCDQCILYLQKGKVRTRVQ